MVSLGQSIASRSPLSQIAGAGNGTLVSAADPTALTKLFADEAQALARQILVSFTVPAARAGSDADIAVSVTAAGTAYTDNAFVSLGDAPTTRHDAAPGTTPLTGPRPGSRSQRGFSSGR